MCRHCCWFFVFVLFLSMAQPFAIRGYFFKKCLQILNSDHFFFWLCRLHGHCNQRLLELAWKEDGLCSIHCNWCHEMHRIKVGREMQRWLRCWISNGQVGGGPIACRCRSGIRPWQRARFHWRCEGGQWGGGRKAIQVQHMPGSISAALALKDSQSDSRRSSETLQVRAVPRHIHQSRLLEDPHENPQAGIQAAPVWTLPGCLCWRCTAGGPHAFSRGRYKIQVRVLSPGVPVLVRPCRTPDHSHGPETSQVPPLRLCFCRVAAAQETHGAAPWGKAFQVFRMHGQFYLQCWPEAPRNAAYFRRQAVPLWALFLAVELQAQPEASFGHVLWLLLTQTLTKFSKILNFRLI